MTTETRNAATRRHVLRAGLGVIAAAGAAGSATAQEKIAQNMVQYQDHPKDNQMCSGCVNFAPPNACNIVAGDIKPNGWCIAYAAKG